MEVTEEIINGEVYTITKHDSGHVIKELKMTDAQKAQMAAAAAVPPPDPLAEVKAKLDKMIADLTEVKADVKAIKEK